MGSDMVFPKLITLSDTYTMYLATWEEMGQLLEIHLLEKSAQHQNLDCSTPFKQIEKKMNLLEKW